MKHFFLIILVLLLSVAGKAQCPQYERLLKEAKAFLKNDQYIAAINKLNSAKEYCPEKAKSIKSEINAVVQAIEKKKKEADYNAEKAENALQKVKITSENAVTILLDEIDRNILYLDYDQTYAKCEVAVKLEAKREEVAKRIQEIAFWQLETDTLNFEIPKKTLQLLQINTQNKSREQLLESIKNINPTHFDNFIMTRYFPEMVFVEGGEFEMGAREDDGFARAYEVPLHKVKLNSFFMAKTEITVWQYHLHLGSIKLFSEYRPSWEWKGDNPMVAVNWYDAVEYNNWLSGRLRKERVYNSKYEQYTLVKGFRLPTEAEWEYAAKGGKFHKRFLFSGSEDIDSVAWYKGNSYARTHEVGTKKANILNIFDMTGNVSEWCQDWYSEYYYEKTPYQNPQGAENGSGRVLRGGYWDCNEILSRVSNRFLNFPHFRNEAYGFRVCLGT